MKSLILIAAIVISPIIHAEESIRDSSRNNSGVRNEYDDLMKSSGKWDFLGTSFLTLGVISGLGSLYCYQRGEHYSDLKKERTLTTHELSEYKQWQDLTNATGYGALGLLGIGFGATMMEMKYENRAHSFALDMKVNF